MTLVLPGSDAADEGRPRRPQPVERESLLARHAPILRLDGRELFRPTSVDGYVESATLWDQHGMVSATVTTDQLDHRWGNRVDLRFVADDERRGVLRREIQRTTRKLLTSRLGAVGLFGRLLDAFFLLSIWLRPTTPRLTTTAASLKAERLGLHDQPTCYGRTVRAGEWIVLHYAFFYAMNDWRTSFRGLNDHEADWEQAWIFCDPQTREPVWVATSNHDYRGPNLRRHWSDPELRVIEGRPELYVAAGSHALYYRPGDYVTRIDIPGLRWLLRWQRSARRFLRYPEPPTERGLGPALGVPFIDAADGEGAAIADWDLVSMDGLEWVESFRGLWGRDTGDPLQGERGPSGPKFDRNGEVRASWADPLGFAGLHGTPPPSAMAARINLDKVHRAIAELDEQIRQRGRLLPLAHQTDSTDEMAAESRRLTELLRQRTELVGLERRIRRGDVRADGIRDHLRHPAVPLESPRGGLLLAAWAAVTTPLLLIAVGAVLIFKAPLAAVGPAVLAGLLLTEQLIRRRFRAALHLLGATAFIAVLGFFVLGTVLAFSGRLIGGVLVVAGVQILLVNGAELLRRTSSAAR